MWLQQKGDPGNILLEGRTFTLPGFLIMLRKENMAIQ